MATQVTADQLLRAAKRAGLPAVTATVGDATTGRQYWITLEDTATAQERAARDAFIAAFNPDDESMKTAELEDAAASRLSVDTRVWLITFYRMTQRRDPTAEEMTAWSTTMREVYVEEMAKEAGRTP